MIRTLSFFCLLLAVLLISACGVVVTPEWEAPPTEILSEPVEAVEEVAVEPTATPVPPTATPEPTLAPTEAPTLAPTSAPTSAPTEAPAESASSSDPNVSTMVLVADPANGETLFNTVNASGYACSGCHLINTEAMLIGPGLLGIGARAETRVAGQDAPTYLYHSITNPNEFVVQGFSPGLMPQNFAQLLTEVQIFDLIAYLLTL
ncbi:MAG: c-type cytochrome [Chloroflexi bacterium]|nr:c-type cytochrome [Chloroflexota bacterium]